MPGEATGASILACGRSVVLVGLMGAGKSAVGRRLAQRLALPFVDADTEIEEAAGCSIADFFEMHGEAEFRAGERRVIARLLEEKVQVLATGGGAYMEEQTRERIARQGISVWLRADIDTLVERTSRRDHRPLLRNDDPRKTLEGLMTERYPIYATANITVETDNRPIQETVERVLQALESYVAGHSSDGAGDA